MRIPDSIVRNEYLKKTAEYFKINENTLRQMLNESRKSGPAPSQEEKDIFLPAEKRLLQLLFNQQEVARMILGEMESDCFRGLASEPVIRYVIDSHRQGQNWSLGPLQTLVTPQLLGQLCRVLQEDIPDGSIGEALDCLNTLKKNSLQKKLKEIQREIALTEKKGDKEKLMSLLYQKHEITRQILML